MNKQEEIDALLKEISLGEMTQQEVAYVLGVSRPYIVQVEAKAIEKLRRAINARLKGASIKTILPD